MPVPRRTVDFAPRLLGIGVRAALDGSERDVDRLERALEAHLEIPHVVAAASGRAALAAILTALALPREQPVLVPGLTDESVPRTVAWLGLGMRFVDADPLDANPDAGEVEAALRQAPAGAVIAAHHFGRVADMDRILAASEAAGTPVVEDATHAVGARWRGRPVGGLGIAGYLSFNFTKPLSGYGGGAILTRDAGLAGEVRRALAVQATERPGQVLGRLAKGAALWALTRRGVFSASLYPGLRAMRALEGDVIGVYKRVADRPGGTAQSGRMSPISARLLLDRLAHLDAAIEGRRVRARVLDDALDPAVSRLEDRPGSEGVAYFYVVRTPERSARASELLRAGIDCGERVLRDVAADHGARGAFPATRRLVEECLQIPIHPGTRSADLLAAARVLNRRSG